MHRFRNSAAALAALMLLASCTNDDPEAKPEPSPTGGEPATDATPDPDYTIIGATAMYGPGRWAITAFGDPDAPMAVIDVPAGFQARESYVWTDQGGDRAFGQVAYWSTTRVPADPCQPAESSRPLGETVEDLAAALVAQKRTTTTTPVPVELGGHRGLYLELTTPADLDYRTCGPDGEMLIFEAGVPGDGRVLDAPAHDRYWILDVDGRRVVITAMNPRGADREAVDLVKGVVNTTTFAVPG